jgi:hypothetical protein
MIVLAQGMFDLKPIYYFFFGTNDLEIRDTTETLEPHGQGKSSGFMECSLIVK